jgi:hypothetical protein
MSHTINEMQEDLFAFPLVAMYQTVEFIMSRYVLLLTVFVLAKTDPGISI